jgi:hypothetical protein
LANAVAPQRVEREELDFDGTVRLAIILGLNAEIRPALTALSALQRKFVRSIDVEFGSQEADNFYSVLGPTLRDVLREVYQEFRVQENLIQFKRQPPSTRLVWFLIGIWAAILANRKHGPNRAFDGVELPVGYLEDLDRRRIAFIGLLDDGDDFQLVVKGHSYLERELREFVLAAATQQAAVKPSEYSYAGTLRLALTLGLDPSLEAGLAAVGTLRNKFAHRVDVELASQEAIQNYERLDNTSQADAQQAWSEAFRKSPDTGRPEHLLEARPRDLIASCMGMLFYGVLLEQLRRRRAALQNARHRVDP